MVFRVLIALSVLIMANCNHEGKEMGKKFRNAVFLHHSTGANIYGPNGSSTSVPEEIKKYNIQNGFTSNNKVSIDEIAWPTVKMGWNNEWYRWLGIFEGTDYVPRWGIRKLLPDFQNANKGWNKIIKKYPVVIIKSCFPSSDLSEFGSVNDTADLTKKTVYNYKFIWRKMIRYFSDHPDNFFVIWTNAPLAREATTPEKALLSDSFCSWAKDTLAAGLDSELHPFPENVYVFDFFHYLSKDGILEDKYAVSLTDSHPNKNATEIVAPLLVKEVFDAAIKYENSYKCSK